MATSAAIRPRVDGRRQPSRFHHTTTDTDAQVPLEIALDIIIPRLKIRSVQGGTDRSLDVEQGRMASDRRHGSRATGVATPLDVRVTASGLTQDFTQMSTYEITGHLRGRDWLRTIPVRSYGGFSGLVWYGSADPPALRSVLLSRSRKVTLHTFNAIYQLQRSGVKW